jgi:hypothetical protein
MTLDALIMFAGFFVAILPFLGFPIQWDNILLVAAGIFIIALGILVRRRGVARSTKPQNLTYTESTPRGADFHDAQ